MPPAPLPPSETQGLDDLDIQSNVFGNLPPPPKFFVNRPQLERALQTRLLDKNHPIITLHGRGGIGKTSLALWAAHELSLQDKPTFSSIVWFSARDVDLLPTGPRPVRAAVIDLTSVAKVYSAMFGSDPTEEGFAKALQTPDSGGAGKLFIFDNFETFSDSRQLHKFLDTHTHLPNKVFMTSRERAFKADYPIEVRGMEIDEAKILCRSAGRDLGIEGILTEAIIESIYRYTDGHLTTALRRPRRGRRSCADGRAPRTCRGPSPAGLTVLAACGKMVLEPSLNSAGSRQWPNNCHLTVTMAHTVCSGSWPQGRDLDHHLSGTQGGLLS
jgi:hypothetical protein